MICKELTKYIDPYLDDELSVIENLRVQAHLVFCGKCKAIVKSEVSLRSLIEADALEDSAPDYLKEKILQQIGERARPEHSQAGGLFNFGARAFLAGLLAGAVTIGVIFSLAVYLFRGLPGDVSPLAAEIVGKHQIYSRGEGNLQIRSSNPLEVASWLRQRLDFPVKLPQLARPGERLVGARLSSISDEQAAFLLYERAGHRLALYVFKAGPTHLFLGTPKSVAGIQFFTSTFEGYSVVWWEEQDRYYAAISDGGINDLIEFGLLCVRGRTS
jgi:anti-sigma factor RsiW